MQSCWQNGRWLPAVQKDSPNREPRPHGETVRLVVLHNISLPPFEYGGDAVERLFTNRIDPQAHPFFRQLVNLRVSAHFVIERGGRVMQFVSCDETAYHAGVSAFRGETGCNRFSVGIELEGCDFEPFTAHQYRALTALLKDLCAAYPIEAVCGHQDIAPARKTDPGHFFDWHHLEKHGFPIERGAAAVGF